MSGYVSLGCCPDSNEPLVRRTLSFSHSLKPVQLFKDPEPNATSHSLSSLPDIPDAKTSSFSAELLHNEKIIQEKLFSESEDCFAGSEGSFLKREKSMTPINSVEEGSYFSFEGFDEPLPDDLKNSPKHSQLLQSSPVIPIPGGGNHNLRARSPNTEDPGDSETHSHKSSSHSDGCIFSFEESNEIVPNLSARRRPSLDYITPLHLDPSEKENAPLKDEDES